MFDRTVDREYDELHVLMKQMYDVVNKDSADISAALPSEGQVSQSPETSVTTAASPLALAVTVMLMPVAIASGFIAGLQDSAPERNARQTPRPQLKLVQS